MIYFVVFLLMGVAAWIGYDMGNVPYEGELYKPEDKEKKDNK
jgi:hypothetical protein